MKIPDFTILTGRSVSDLTNDVYTERDLLREQAQKCHELGIDFNEWSWGKQYKCHFFESPFMGESTFECDLWEAVQILASKEGFDLVQYKNGNYGFVAYYSGCKNGFEIIKDN